METINIIKQLHFSNALWILFLPLALMGIDIVTGLINAIFKEKNFESSVMRSGLVKKAGEIAILLLGILFTHGMTLPDYLMKAVSLYLIIMELMSILENLDKMGVPLPKFVKNVVNNVSTAILNDDISELNQKVNKLEKALDAYNTSKISVNTAAADIDDGK